MEYPVRVAQVVGKMLGGGVEQVVMNYYRHIDREKVQFDFLVDADSTLIPKEEIESLGGRVYIIPPYQRPVAYQKKLIELFRHEGWKIVHSHINAMSVFPLCAAKRAGVPIRIAHSHSTSGKGEYVKNAMKCVLKQFSNIYPTNKFACGQYAGEWLFGKNAQFELMYNAIDLKNYVFDPSVRTTMREELGLNESQLVIGHVGRFMQQKNHQFLIDTFAELSQREAGAVLLLVGEGELQKPIEKLVADRDLVDKVIFLGRREDVNRLYQAFDVLCLPSLYEGLCLVGVEAQRAGLPCVLADSITREVDVTNRCIFLPIADPAVWADAICDLGSNSNLERSSIDAGAFSNYDIQAQGLWLTNRYLDLLEGA